MDWKTKRAETLRFLKRNPCRVSRLVPERYGTRQGAHRALSKMEGIDTVGYVRVKDEGRTEKVVCGWKPHNVLHEELITGEIWLPWWAGLDVRRGKFADQDVHADATVHVADSLLVHIEMDLDTEPLTRSRNGSCVEDQMRVYAQVSDWVIWYTTSPERMTKMIELYRRVDEDENRWFGVAGGETLVSAAYREMSTVDFWAALTNTNQRPRGRDNTPSTRATVFPAQQEYPFPHHHQ